MLYSLYKFSSLSAKDTDCFFYASIDKDNEVLLFEKYATLVIYILHASSTVVAYAGLSWQMVDLCLATNLHQLAQLKKINTWHLC